MPLTLDPTPGGTGSNSLVSLDEAIAYFDGRMASSAWDAADQATRTRALVAATARLEQENYEGRRAIPGQALKWPRVGACDDDGVEYDATTVPRPVQAACCELALALLVSGDTDLFAPTGLESFAGLKVGSLDLTMLPGAPAPGALPAQVARLLRGLLTTSVRSNRTVRAS